ncbi:MAG TPA: hypothetical protein VG935_05140 [Patescibacteria group bacterium]|nr:hypothetical protein [Patescibacteria group bacterium]
MKPEQQKNFLIILIPSTILILIWIILGIYNHSINSTISQTQAVAINPIAPTFDMSVFSLLKKRVIISPTLEISTGSTETTSSGSAQITPSISPVQQASSQAELSSP